ncbi:hypothetical protein M406DRAFT_354927 [Cryphonectria parasitica EP155]|uniref:Uncharacterized protein n=1 Tax=Cryphonectria parasitica (strain ATCC 38755 / EP155) TaxID=660469 RepID=A0A9P4Y9M2_CRYP1|nr:uncharacterized protein M406DRAFT_354927 [Cryphonectria parasitica EP155]KAF3768585.1 hypothetical protein M406DRAFT_354927 [Cryphonectria parasitica EP155]
MYQIGLIVCLDRTATLPRIPSRIWLANGHRVTTTARSFGTPTPINDVRLGIHVTLSRRGGKFLLLLHGAIDQGPVSRPPPRLQLVILVSLLCHDLASPARCPGPWPGKSSGRLLVLKLRTGPSRWSILTSG